VDVAQPVRSLNLAAKLKDPSNTSAPELSFQCKAVQDFHSRSVQLPPPAENHQVPTFSTSPPPSAGIGPVSQHKRNISSINDDDDEGENGDESRLQQCRLLQVCRLSLTHSVTLVAKKKRTVASSSKVPTTSGVVEALDLDDEVESTHAKGMILLACFETI
jgi:hypothetical protein